MKEIRLIAILMLCPVLASAKLIDRLEASVNSSPVLLSDVLHFRETVALRAQLDPLFSGSPLASAGSRASDPSIVQFLINERLILGSFPVKDAAVEQEINSIQSSNRFDREALIQALREQGFQFKDYFELIRSSIAKRNLIDRDIRTKVHISEDDIKNYFYNQYLKSGGNRSYRLQLLSISKDSYVSQEAAYDAIKKAADAIQAGESFEEVVKRFSDGPNASSGGDLGFLVEEDISPLLRKQVLRLKVGKSSNIIRTDDGGYVIVRLADIRTGQEQKLKEVTPEIQSQLASVEYQRQIDFWLKRRRQNAHIHFAPHFNSKSGTKKKK